MNPILIPLLEAIVKVQRDHGGRADRKHARLKYLIDDWGFDKFKATVWEYAGKEYPEPRGVEADSATRLLGLVEAMATRFELRRRVD